MMVPVSSFISVSSILLSKYEAQKVAIYNGFSCCFSLFSCHQSEASVVGPIAARVVPGSTGGHQGVELTSEVVCVDDHLSLGQLSATQLSLDCQLYAPNNLVCNSSNSLGGHEEAIIEMQEPALSLMQTPQNSNQHG